MATKSADLKSALGQLDDTLELYLVDKAPFTLPDNVKEIIVKFAPWIGILMLVISVPGILLALGAGALVGPFTALLGPAYAVSFGLNYTISMLVLAVSVILEAIAIPGLFKTTRKAWTLVYYATLINIVSSLIGGNIVSGLVVGLISLYILYQVKTHYK